ncbi:MAG: DegT/DnrJ/EryC1/StrS aminotransferase family protein [Nitrospira sp.]|nr:DegT/DnrJ/EryC1/StrS aminotransferase family protein [Nitrospira sp.]
MAVIVHSKPWITDDDHHALSEVLASNMLAQGELCRVLELKLAEWVAAVDGVATGSGSAALVLALKALGVGAGDEVILPSYICRSVLEAVITVKGVPVLCDVGKEWVMTAESVVCRLTSKTKAIIAAHMYGVFADIKSIAELGIPVIEDCAQAVEDCRQRPVHGEVAIFSFHPTKCLTSAEGGLVVSSDLGMAEKMREIRDGNVAEAKPRLFAPLSDLTAGLALSQLKRYPTMLARRRSIAERYLATLEHISSVSLNREAFANSMFFRFPVRTKGGLQSCQQAFLDRGIHVRRGVDMLLHRLIGLADREYPVSTELFHTTVSLPIYPALSVNEEASCVENAALIFSGLN